MGFTARQFCKYMQRFARFLSWKPSTQAAAAVLLAVNLNLSQLAPHVGLKHLKGTKVKALVKKASANGKEGPLCLWSAPMTRLTFVEPEEIAPVYSALMDHLNRYQFSNRLLADAGLWLQPAQAIEPKSSMDYTMVYGQ